MQLTVTFKLGTDPNIDQVLVQNRVAIAQPQLPPEVTNIGVVTAKQSPDVIMAIALSSESKAYNPLYLSNYAYTQMEDSLKRIEGVGNIQVHGAQPYSMRVWLDPDLMFSRGLAADDVISALRAQNQQDRRERQRPSSREGPHAEEDRAGARPRLRSRSQC